MKLTFHSAAREVTGSCHEVQTDRAHLLLDCGLIQGGSERHERNRADFDFDPAALDTVVLSHAHIDHSGRIPLLCKRGFSGKIRCTRATAELLAIMLPDSARIQEEDARWKIKRLKKKGKDSSWVKPLYTEDEAWAALEQLDPVEFGEQVEIANGVKLTFAMAGHILGAGIVQLSLEDAGETKTLTFSGDLGVEGDRLLSKPDEVERPDFLIMESTYGNRNREDVGDRTEELYKILKRTLDRGGKLIIPAFAVGRTQSIVARINDIVEAGRLPGVEVFVDSPMAVRTTHLFRKNRDFFSDEAQELAEEDAPLMFDGLTLVTKVEDSIQLNKRTEPCVIISASGMCTAGRIKHHLKYNIDDARNTILFVGYQAHGSLGRLIRDGLDRVRIFGEWYEVRAEIASVEGFSAHADKDELIEWFRAFKRPPKHSFIVHGEEKASLAFAETITSMFAAEATVPERGKTYEV